MNIFSKSISIQFVLSAIFISLSFTVRVIFMIWIYEDFSCSFLNLFGTFLIGFLYDVGIVSFFWLLYSLSQFLMPNRLRKSYFNKGMIYFFTSIFLLIMVFVFFAEVTFWEEFKSRFNFVAVDYLIYTYEVINNINQSYPLVVLIPSVLIITALFLYLIHKTGAFNTHFNDVNPKISFLKPIVVSLAIFTAFIFSFKIKDYEWSSNRYNNEISKAGIHAFFVAFKTEKLDFLSFYKSLDNETSFRIVKQKIKDNQTSFESDLNSIKRKIKSVDSLESYPNVVLIMMESMSASFMKTFGNEKNITPHLDSLAQNSFFFTNLFATGTRTVRGMEAITMSIPPTPGSSIVKRPNNQNLFTVARVFESKLYDCNFFYGGDGYFDNMNAFFGNNGFNIFDRNHGSILSEDIPTNHEIISDEEVTFENAWGICDEDIYQKMIRVADAKSANGKPFFNFIMTTSNHRPYSYPEGKIDIPSKKGREGAVKYADYALNEFLKVAKTKAWYDNTIFVVVADHCASSAGKDEIDVKNYHIPAFIFGKSIPTKKIDKLVSQIDVLPTLFGILNWNYTSNFYGQNVDSNDYDERAFVGTYLKLGYKKNDTVVVLSHGKKINQYSWHKENNFLEPQKTNNQKLINEAISYYQTAAYLFENQKLK